ncbi:helix-turn-helix domain-containing protein [Enterococcus caccae]|uniref:Helix-turn-helix conjugative transposon-like domain-containing protein n=1 Tax=Enterococcus caccae ATCC BAA-1240 TaxID=1158612 RepID=R3WP81_9ENTE|nr:helix-turn-helix domain-containing protein [Enterococcus caccae]EOL43645.1 hypothetical protein UC7_02975 [Enterococcus caccae ATCC BAA-1240]EOT67955.1 hypothetical protein I580_00337 [Enterococcus caccae ATCC BAA-1240]OJG28555.1 hypothetical protein RU98_GL000148 [Enterococcus caccae]
MLEALMKAAQAGDPTAYHELFLRFWPLLINQANRKGYFDQDCFDECIQIFYLSIDKFKFLE